MILYIIYIYMYAYVIICPPCNPQNAVDDGPRPPPQATGLIFTDFVAEYCVYTFFNCSIYWVI
jgi:hypothetical protein